MENYLPHSGDMVFVDGILEFGEDFVRTFTCVEAENAFLRDANFEAFGLVEVMAQTLGVFRALKDPKQSDKLGFLLGVREFVCERENFAVGTRFETTAQVSLMDEASGLGVYDCEVFVEGKRAASAKISTLNKPE